MLWDYEIQIIQITCFTCINNKTPIQHCISLTVVVAFKSSFAYSENIFVMHSWFYDSWKLARNHLGIRLLKMDSFSNLLGINGATRLYIVRLKWLKSQQWYLPTCSFERKRKINKTKSKTKTNQKLKPSKTRTNKPSVNSVHARPCKLYRSDYKYNRFIYVLSLRLVSSASFTFYL